MSAIPILIALAIAAVCLFTYTVYRLSVIRAETAAEVRRLEHERRMVEDERMHETLYGDEPDLEIERR